MDIRKIALYLAWKLSPYYIKPNPWRFLRLLKDKFPSYVENDQLNFIQSQSNQSEEIYFSVLEDIYTDYKTWVWYDAFLWLLADLKIPDEIYSSNATISTWEYNWEIYEKKLKKMYGSNPTTIEKWQFFQELCYDILRIVGWFVNIYTSAPGPDWGVDITADKEITLWDWVVVLLWFFWQAKYKTTGTVSKKEITDLLSPINKDKTNKYQCVFYFTNRTYSPGANTELRDIDWWNTNRKCFALDWNKMLDIINACPEIQKKYSI